MVKKRLKNPIFLFYLLVGYVIIQFSWWLFLIFSLYEKTYDNPDELRQKTWMLIGEGSVFFILLILGVVMIRKAFKKEKKLNEIQENFLQSVSHELKTPISSVGLYLQTLQKHQLDQSKREDIYQRSLDEIERLNHLISDILTARNIESDNYYFNKESFDIGEHLQSTLNRFKDTILKNRTVEFNIEHVSHPLDKSAFDGIIYNLVENAIKYSPENSKIGFDLIANTSGFTFRITDEGQGIPNELKKRVFDKFYRAENESTRKTKGTGLGMYIVRFLVEGQGGKISLKDNKPTGLIVEIEFSNKHE